MSDKVRLFANGYEFDVWTERNCEKCQLAYKDNMWGWPCEIQKAVDMACIDDGTIPQEIADRMGFNDTTMFQLGWPCKERQEVDR